MSTTSAFNRGKVKTAVARLSPSNNGAANGVTIKLPQNSVLLRSTALSLTAFDGSGTVTVTSTDGTTAFWSAVNVKDAAGFETVSTAPPKSYPGGGTITTYIADQNSDSEAGDVVVIYEYVELNEGTEVYG
jgi:hypothetical protein